MQYSRLAFTREYDRPIAIAGLEKRLIQSFGVHGGFGIFDDEGLGMLRRSLLWHRGAGEPSLRMIDFGDSGNAPPPSWSWMAHSGGIEYLDLPFAEIDWERKEILSPWSPQAVGVWYSSDYVGVVELNAIARDFNCSAMDEGEDSKIIYDVDDTEVVDDSGEKLKCVVMGTLKSKGTADRQIGNRRHYIMLVRITESRESSGSMPCKRIGAGYVPGRMIDLAQNGTQVKVR